MHHVVRAGIGVVAAVGMLALNVAAAHAAGALAVGACAAYGYAYDYKSSDAAQAAAIEKCGDSSCDKVVTTEKGCLALAVDGHKPCGPNGYANAGRLGAAQNAALKQCYQYGGKDCVIRAFICDGKKG
jgi:hypothetical protein